MQMGSRRRWRELARSGMGGIGENAPLVASLRIPPPLSNCALGRLRRDLLGLRLPDLCHADWSAGNLRGCDFARFAPAPGTRSAAAPAALREIEAGAPDHGGARRGIGYPSAGAGLSRPRGAGGRRLGVGGCDYG